MDGDEARLRVETLELLCAELIDQFVPRQLKSQYNAKLLQGPAQLMRSGGISLEYLINRLAFYECDEVTQLVKLEQIVQEISQLKRSGISLDAEDLQNELLARNEIQRNFDSIRQLSDSSVARSAKPAEEQLGNGSCVAGWQRDGDLLRLRQENQLLQHKIFILEQKNRQLQMQLGKCQ